MDKITITKDVGTPTEEKIEVSTNGYLLAYLDKTGTKIMGNLGLSSFAPLIRMAMKFFVDRMEGGETKERES